MAMNTVCYIFRIIYCAQRVVRCVLIINLAFMHIRFNKNVVDHAFNLIYYVIIIEITISTSICFMLRYFLPFPPPVLMDHMHLTSYSFLIMKNILLPNN